MSGAYLKQRLWQCPVCDAATRDPERNRWEKARLQVVGLGNLGKLTVWVCRDCILGMTR